MVTDDTAIADAAECLIMLTSMGMQSHGQCKHTESLITLTTPTSIAIITSTVHTRCAWLSHGCIYVGLPLVSCLLVEPTSIIML